MGLTVCSVALAGNLSAQELPSTAGTDRAARAAAIRGSAHWTDLKPIAVQAHAFAETPELKKLPPGPPAEAATEGGPLREIPIFYIHHGANARRSPQQLDPVIQSFAPSLNIPSPGLTFDGVNNHCNCSPPDTNGRVGPSNYVQVVNTHFQVFNKFTGAAQTAVLAINSLFTGLGNPCATTDDGDPVVLYDALADRWIITQFADVPGGPPFFMSIAVSKTADPLGAYYLYCFQMPNSDLNDYPKLSVWPDGYYMTDNQFNAAGTAFLGAGVFAFDRAKMLVGDPTAGYLYFDLLSVDSSIGGVLPSDMDGPPPPVGTPDYFSYFTSTAFGEPQDGLRVFQFHADFATPANSTFTERPESPISVAAFTPFSPGTNTIPQSGTTQKLDSLGDRLMHRLQYRNFTSNETLVVTHTVNGGSAQAAIRYYQLRRNLPGSNFGVYDQATFAPDALYRWMGSAGMDYLGNLAVGYSVSSTTNFASIRYAGRLASDPTNGLFQGEGTLQTGAGAQTGSKRWGDYSGLSVDPSDDFTFWYTTEYYSSSSSATWNTRIGKFQLGNFAAAPSGVIRGIVTSGVAGPPLSNIVIRTTSGFFRVTDTSGVYSMTVAPGAYDMSAFSVVRGTLTTNSVSVAASGITTQNFVYIPAPLIVTNSATITSEGCTSPNGVIDPGETVTVSFGLKNIGSADASNVVATMLVTNGVASPSGPQTYGLLTAGGAAAAQSFTFTAAGSCGSNIIATLQIQNLATNLGNVGFPFSLGLVSPTTNSFANTGTISVPTGGTSGKATPYPSTITVSGLASTVSKVTVTLTNVSHTWVNDLDILLVGPGGQKAMIMSDVGNDSTGTPISNQTFIFDDAAASFVSTTTPVVGGTFKPTDYQTGDILDSPAPAGPYGTALSVFNGVDPNGTWSLYVDDDFPGADGGGIAKGWKITIVTTTNSCCTGSSNHPPVISAASVSPGSPTTTNILTITGISTNDLDSDPITLAYQWQQSTNNVTFANIAFVANTLPAAATIAGDYYRMTITPNDGHANGAPFTTASVLVPVDADGNGINDDWEVQYFGHMGINPNADADGTGQNNLFKYVTGLDPTNPTSVFIFQIAAVTNQPTQDKLLFNPLASGRTYTPQFNTDLANSAWLPLTGYLGPVTNGNQVTITDTNATPPNEFYRIDISLP